MPATTDNILTLDKIQFIFPEAVTLAEGLLFAPFPQTSLDKMMLNEGVMIVGLELLPLSFGLNFVNKKFRAYG